MTKKDDARVVSVHVGVRLFEAMERCRKDSLSPTARSRWIVDAIMEKLHREAKG